MRVRGATALAVMIAAAAACSRSVPAPPQAPEESSAATELGPHRPGMTLRQTFDSLAAGTAHTARLELLEENVAAWRARWRLLAGARETIDVDYFIFSQDVFGMAFLGHLLAKARQGVRVRIQLDAQGRQMAVQPHDLDCLGYLATAQNVSIRVHRSLPRRLIEALARLDPIVATASDHDKILVTDRRVSIVGGRNIEAKYFADPRDLPTAFHDVDLQLDGRGVADALTAVFETTFESDRVAELHERAADTKRCAAALPLAYAAMDAWLAGKPLAESTARALADHAIRWDRDLEAFPRLQQRPAPRAAVRAETRVLDSLPRPGTDADAVSQGLTRLFEAASDTILMESPYVVLTEDAADVLQATGQRGVTMTLLTNSPISTDNALSQTYFGEQWPRLLAAVQRLRLYASGTPHNIHSKFVVFDDQVVLLGSYNLDPFSMLISGEVMVAVWSRRFAEQIARRPLTMIATGPPEVYEYTIARNPNGAPLRTDAGEPIVAFGPADHGAPDRAPSSPVSWALRDAIPWLAGLPPLF